jgi:ferric-dicitrate binding protein FerR (iron transport regulator)
VAGFSVEDAWQETATRARARSILLNAKQKDSTLAQPEILTKVIPLWRRWSVAASIGGVILLSGFIYWNNFYNPIITYKNSLSSVQVITLPDGTLVDLQKGAQISYNKYFKDSVRLVSLIGKAKFSVHKDPNQPFKIDTGPTNIRVLGTTFNLEANPNFNDLSVVEGLVALKDLKSGLSIKLATGQRALFKDGGIAKLPDAAELNFDEKTLTEALAMLSAYHQRSIVVSESLIAKAKNTKISGSFEGLTFEKCVESITIYLRANTVVKANGIEIVSFVSEPK